MVERQMNYSDIWSIHLYAWRCETTSQIFGVNCSLLLSNISALASKYNALFMLGEYGSTGPFFAGPNKTDLAFVKTVLDTQVADARINGSFAISLLWAWQCPSHAEMVCTNPTLTASPLEAVMSKSTIELINTYSAYLNCLVEFVFLINK